MDCDTVQQHIDTLRDGRLEPEVTARVTNHLAHCPVCRAFETDVELLRHRLATAAPPAPSMDLAERSFRRIRNRSRLPAAMAASVALAVAVLAGLMLTLPRQAAEPGLATSEDWQTRTIQLALEAPIPMDAVRFRLELPESVEIEGHPGRRTLEWTDDLAAGPNRLSIPLVVMGRTDGEILARLEHQGRVREIRVPVDSSAQPR